MTRLQTSHLGAIQGQGIEPIEIWNPVVGWEGYYEVSSEGRVRSLPRKVKSCYGSYSQMKGRILKLRESNCGYLLIMLSVNSRKKVYSVHRLVAEAFLPDFYTKKTVNHKNLNKKDNRLQNLEMASYSENEKHFIRLTGFPTHKKGEDVYNAKLVKEDILEIFRLREVGLFHKEIAKRFNVCRQHITDILGKKKWAHVWIQ